MAEHDYFPRVEAERFVAALPHAELAIIPSAGHLMPLQVPEAFAERVCGFLDQPKTRAELARIQSGTVGG